MASPTRERVTDADRRQFKFAQTLLRISEALTRDETANLKLFCMHLIPKGIAAKLRRAVDVFQKLIELDKIDQENLEFVEEILEQMGRQDLIRDVLRPFQPPDREIPENPELQPGTSEGGASPDGTATSNAYLIIHGHRRMIQETVDRHRSNLASLCGTRRSQVKFRGYKKGRSILVHFSIPRENTTVLRHMADHSDPRLVFMGVKSLQINAEKSIDVTQGARMYDFKRRYAADDIEVGCSTPRMQQRAPKMWYRLSALNLFSDALPLHLQVAESLEYQGFSYSLVQALVQKDQEREHKMRQVIQNFKQTEVDSNTFMTMRSKLIITENRLKEALETITVLEEKLQQAREYAEKAAQQVTPHVPEYTGEKPPGDWSAHVEKVDVATQTHLSYDKDTTDRPANVSDRFGAESVTHGVTTDKRETKVTYGAKGSDPGMFERPRGVVVTPSNEIFVADVGNRRVQVHSTEGVYLRHFPTVVPGTRDKKMEPHDVCVDGNGTLWVVGEGQSADHVIQYSKDGAALTQFDLRKVDYFRAIAVDMRTGHVLVTERRDNRGEVQVFRPDGDLVRRFGHPEGKMSYPRCITMDGEGNILVSDWVSDSVYMFDESGKLLRTFGGRGRGKGQLRSPRGICTDSLGHIIVADPGNKRVQIFTQHGEFVRHIDNEHITEGVAVGPDGQLVLTNVDDHSVTVYSSY